MEFVPYSLLENLYNELPNIDEYNNDYFQKYFEFDNKHYCVKFYKASENGMKFWIYNPHWVQIVIKNGSHFVS